jgi:diguanylate cyclase (GGDEF)-like protein/PAS domain S-box-containing protein
MTTLKDALLLVDDNEANRDMLSRRLQRHGFDVVTAVDGNHALELVDAREFALVLLDIEMPRLSGLDVLRVIRQRRSASELPIIMVTARQESADIVEALNAGANDYVTKPVDLPVALARIHAQLARRRAEAALRESEERYALALRGANDGLWDWNLRTDEVFFSDRWKQMLGLTNDIVAGIPDEWFQRVHSDDVDRLRTVVAAHLEGLAPHFESEHRVLHADGTYRWMLARGVAVRDATGRAHRMAGSLTDITEGKVSDPLTGLPNRVLFLDRLGQSMERAKRHACVSAVLFVDLDRFKLVNDSLGHEAGDRFLAAIANRLERSVRTVDTVARVNSEVTVARIGGDEFTILLENVRHASDAVRVAERIQECLKRPFELDGRQLFTSASIGIATSETGYSDAQDLLRDADTAMYRAKALGKARCEVFDVRMREAAIARLAVETDLRRAIEQNEFELHYQPIISLATGRLAGFEALVRWRHPQRGLVSPQDFIGIAEETGLIVPLGTWVLNRACTQMSEWYRAHPSSAGLTIHVNLSARQFVHPDLVTEIAGILRATGLPASSLNLEITESAVIENPDSVIGVLEALKALGLRISIDDFGTGHSSLSYLHRFPIDALKIDRSFVSAMTIEQSSIIQAIVALAQALRLEVIAEGIETVDQLSRLSQLGSDGGQGYLFAAALSSSDAESVLANSQEINAKSWIEASGGVGVSET